MLLLKKIPIGSFLSSDGKNTIVCPLCKCDETFEHLFLECKFSCSIWSIFFGNPIVWNHKRGLSWHEILAGFVETFDVKMNCFWFTLTNEVLWFIWRQRNEEIFQGKQRDLTGFF